MLFWPRPSQRLSSVDFMGFTAKGGGRRKEDGEGWWDLVVRAKQVQHNTVKPIPAPLFPDERGPDLAASGAL